MIMTAVVITAVTILITYMILFHFHRCIVWISALLCLPIYTMLRLLNFVIQTILWLTGRQLEDGRFTIWLVIQSKAMRLWLTLNDDLTQTFETLVEVFGGRQMAIEVQEPGEKLTYVPVSEREETKAERAEIYFTKIPARKKADIRDGMVGLNKKGRVSQFRSNRVALDLTLAQMSGWNNKIVRNGQPIEYDHSDPEASFNLLPITLQEELIAEYGSAGEEEGEADDGDDGAEE